MCIVFHHVFGTVGLNKSVVESAVAVVNDSVGEESVSVVVISGSIVVSRLIVEVWPVNDAE